MFTEFFTKKFVSTSPSKLVWNYSNKRPKSVVFTLKKQVSKTNMILFLFLDDFWRQNGPVSFEDDFWSQKNKKTCTIFYTVSSGYYKWLALYIPIGFKMCTIVYGVADYHIAWNIELVDGSLDYPDLIVVQVFLGISYILKYSCLDRVSHLNVRTAGS